MREHKEIIWSGHYNMLLFHSIFFNLVDYALLMNEQMKLYEVPRWWPFQHVVGYRETDVCFFLSIIPYGFKRLWRSRSGHTLFFVLLGECKCMLTLLQCDIICVYAGRRLWNLKDGDCFSVILGQAYCINSLAAKRFISDPVNMYLVAAGRM